MAAADRQQMAFQVSGFRPFRLTLAGAALLAMGGAAMAEVPCRTSGSFENWLAGVKQEARAQGISAAAIAQAEPYMTYEQKIAGLDQELESLRAQVRKEAEAEKARIIAGAEDQARRMAAEAEAQIAVETERVRRELKTEVVNAAMTAAVGLLQKHTGADDQARLTERFVEELEGPRARSAAST